ncbi:GNAT family N-acetyltransferase [Paenibacillus physcomitrellae]|nr:GNAT family N-acetyltransferase [Paenibacillus physcomitrellae]
MEIDDLVWTPAITPGPMVKKTKEQYLQQCPPGNQLVACLGSRLVGYIGFDNPTGLASNRHVYEINIAIHPEFQHRGIGMKLMEAMKEQAKADGVRKLSLRVLSTNQAAKAFYERCSFRVQGVLPEEFWLDGRYVDDILMWCPVS